MIIFNLIIIYIFDACFDMLKKYKFMTKYRRIGVVGFHPIKTIHCTVKKKAIRKTLKIIYKSPNLTSYISLS